MLDQKEYSEEIHITASEVRAMGVNLPDHIPDCAYTERSGMGVKPISTSAKFGERGGISIQSEITFNYPWRWLKLSVTAEKIAD
jgi:hypothetical protein